MIELRNMETKHLLLGSSLVVTCLIIGVSSACRQGISSPSYQANPNQTAGVVSLNDSQAIAAQSEHAIRQEITVVARVKKLLPEDVVGLPHQKFLIELPMAQLCLLLMI
jgi:hypothetical protein